jgi:hypothetical protein
MSLPSMAMHYSLKSTVFWVVMPCNFKRDQYSEEYIASNFRVEE